MIAMSLHWGKVSSRLMVWVRNACSSSGVESLGWPVWVVPALIKVTAGRVPPFATKFCRSAKEYLMIGLIGLPIMAPEVGGKWSGSRWTANLKGSVMRIVSGVALRRAVRGGTDRVKIGIEPSPGDALGIQQVTHILAGHPNGG